MTAPPWYQNKSGAWLRGSLACVVPEGLVGWHWYTYGEHGSCFTLEEAKAAADAALIAAGWALS